MFATFVIKGFVRKLPHIGPSARGRALHKQDATAFEDDAGYLLNGFDSGRTRRRRDGVLKSLAKGNTLVRERAFAAARFSRRANQGP